MVIWKVDFTTESEDDLKKLSKDVRLRAIEKIEWLKNNFDSVIPLPLGNVWSGFFKLRIGDYRVIYKIDWNKNLLTVVALKHRSKIYKI